MNNKGMTLIELVTSFTLSSVIIVLLINVLLIIKDVYYTASIKSELIITQSGLSRQLNSKMKAGNFIDYNTCGDDCYDLTFSDGISRLSINRDNNSITFGDTKYKYLDSANIGSIEITKEKYDTHIENDSLFVIKIPVSHADFKDFDFGINAIYQYSIQHQEQTPLKDLIENDTSHIKRDILVNGKKVNKVYGTKAEQTTMRNYVVYSGQLWEIVETNESNNTIKLVSAVSLTSIAYGNTNNWNTSWVRKWLNEYFYSKLERTDIIRDTEFCIDNVDVDPSSYTKMTSCTNKVNEKVGLLTYEDYIYALDGETIKNGNSFLDEDELSWTITPTSENKKYIWHTDYTNISKIIKGASSNGTAANFVVNPYGQGVRPVISIMDNVLVKSGSGTRKNPYILSIDESLNKNDKINLARVGDYVYIDESKNPYVSEITETRLTKIKEKTPTSKVRYRIVNINEDGTVKLERADVLRNLPSTIAAGSSSIYTQFYSIDSGEGSTSCMYDPSKKYGDSDYSVSYYLKGCKNHNIFNPNEGSGTFEKNTGESLAYYLNNASNGFYNWYSEKAKKMIVKTNFNLNTDGYGKDYSNLNDNPSGTYPNRTNDGTVSAYVRLPSWGEIYTGNDLNYAYWYINRNQGSSDYVSIVNSTGLGTGFYLVHPWVAVRPVITLSSNVYITGGDGTPVIPYSLDIE